MTELQKSPERWSHEWQPRTVATPQDLMAPGAPVPSLHIFHYVLEFYVSGSFGHKSEACSGASSFVELGSLYTQSRIVLIQIHLSGNSGYSYSDSSTPFLSSTPQDWGDHSNRNEG